VAVLVQGARLGDKAEGNAEDGSDLVQKLDWVTLLDKLGNQIIFILHILHPLAIIAVPLGGAEYRYNGNYSVFVRVISLVTKKQNINGIYIKKFMDTRRGENSYNLYIGEREVLIVG
jgi:hypothetical protein